MSHLLIVKRLELYMDLALYKINILLKIQPIVNDHFDQLNDIKQPFVTDRPTEWRSMAVAVLRFAPLKVEVALCRRTKSTCGRRHRVR